VCTARVNAASVALCESRAAKAEGGEHCQDDEDMTDLFLWEHSLQFLSLEMKKQRDYMSVPPCCKALFAMVFTRRGFKRLWYYFSPLTEL
jgi:hypothetical protein